MISLTIPTMWAYPNFLDFLPKVLERESIGEVIIINNDVDKTPSNDILKHDKIKIHNCEENIFVVPSWNLGASLAKYPILGFLGDDVEVNVGVFDKVSEFIKPEMGMIGLLSSYFTEDYEKIYHKFLIDDSITFSDPEDPDYTKRPPPCGIGNLFFVLKQNWLNIPNVKIFHGEIILWNKLSQTKKNYMITNCSNQTPWNVTWKFLADNESNKFTTIQHEDQKLAESMNFTF